MGIDWFGFKKKEEAQKSALRKEIMGLISDNDEKAESRAGLQDWEPSDQRQGKAPKVSYKTLESIYKRESWVRACIDAISRATTSSGFRLINDDRADTKPLKHSETYKIYNLLSKPNGQDSFTDIIAEVAVDLHLYGDAYIEIVKDSKGIPVALYNLYAPSVRVLVNKHGTVMGYVQNAGGSLGNASKPVLFGPQEIVHFKLPNPGNAVYGLSPLESLALPIETDLYAQNYNLNFFKNNATPKLHVDLGTCTLSQLKRTREFFRHQFQGSANAHKTLITEGGVKVATIGIKPNDMEFLNQRKFSRDEICAVMGVPPMKIGIFEDVNRASATESDKAFKAEKIIPLQRMIARKININIINLFNKSRVVLSFSEVDLRDSKEQAEIDKIEIESGVTTADEVRMRRGLPRLKEDEKKPKEDSNNGKDTDEETDSNKNLVIPKNFNFFR